MEHQFSFLKILNLWLRCGIFLALFFALHVRAHPQLNSISISGRAASAELELDFLEKSSVKNFECITGETVIVLLSRKAGASYRVQLSHHNKKILSSPLIEKNDKQFALLGIPYGLKTGSYTLSLIYENADSTEKIDQYTAKKVILIRQRRQYKEEIVLNRTLSMRRKAPASKKARSQAVDMWKITGELRSETFLAYDRFIFPVKTYKYISGAYSDARNFMDSEGNMINSSIHGGIDIAAAAGTPVFSAAAGVVVFAEDRVVTGKTVVLSHFPGVYTLFYHLNSIEVEPGAVVAQGTRIGKIGNTGFSTAPHLHWEMRVNNVRVDPFLSMGVLDKVFTLNIE